MTQNDRLLSLILNYLYIKNNKQDILFTSEFQDILNKGYKNKTLPNVIIRNPNLSIKDKDLQNISNDYIFEIETKQNE